MSVEDEAVAVAAEVPATHEQALKRARFWLDTLIAYYGIDPTETNITARFSKGGADGVEEVFALSTVNLAEDLEAFAALGAGQLIAHDDEDDDG